MSGKKYDFSIDFIKEICTGVVLCVWMISSGQIYPLLKDEGEV